MLFSLALMLMTSFTFANTNEIKPVINQMSVPPLATGIEADKAVTCKVTVEVGGSIVSITITCECTTIQACNAAYTIATLPWMAPPKK